MSDQTNLAGDQESVKLQEQIEELKGQIEFLTNQWKRALADYQNLQKRIEKEKESWWESSALDLWRKLLSVFDNLQKAQEHLSDAGLGMVLGHFQKILSEENLREIEVKAGDSFDPQFQECVEVVPGEPENKIAAVVAKGYIIGERVVRPVKVKVYKKEAANLPPQAEKEMEGGDYV